jgi:formylglycine-generating enzyme required for sulfatase activity
MVTAPAGSFTMGSSEYELERERDLKGAESPQLKVTFVRPFAVAKLAVTRGEFAAFITETGRKMSGGCEVWVGTKYVIQAELYWHSPGFIQEDRHPVVCVNLDSAKAYADWLSAKTGKVYRLLSEAEREYVTRAGTTTPFWWGATITTTQANYDGSKPPYGSFGPTGLNRNGTFTADGFEANPWGLHNVHGNAWEMTGDCWNPSHTGNPGNGNARTAGDCSHTVLRGGAWANSPTYLRSASRVIFSTHIASNRVGFRVARTY